MERALVRGFILLGLAVLIVDIFDVDVYRAHTPETLLAGSLGGMERLCAELRAIEAADPQCRRYPRIKPADDAAAICLASA